jgi:hypothetical protein
MHKTLVLLALVLILTSCNEQGKQDFSNSLYLLDSYLLRTSETERLNKQLSEYLPNPDTAFDIKIERTTSFLDSISMLLIIKANPTLTTANFWPNYFPRDPFFTLKNKEFSASKDFIKNTVPEFERRLNEVPEHLNSMSFQPTWKAIDASEEPVYSTEPEVKDLTFVDMAFNNKNLIEALIMINEIKLSLLDEQRRYLQSKLNEI